MITREQAIYAIYEIINSGFNNVNIDSWMLNRQFSTALTLKATEIVHTRVFVNTGAPLITLAAAHFGNIDVTHVGATARVGELTRNGMCRKR